VLLSCAAADSPRALLLLLVLWPAVLYISTVRQH
jgi:hypothetical protein